MSSNNKVIFLNFERNHRLRLDQFSYEKPFILDLYLKGIDFWSREHVPESVLTDLNMTDVVIKIYEVDIWVKQNSDKKIYERRKGSNKVIATIEGEINKGLFTISEIDLEPFGKDDSLFSPPALPIQFKNSGTVYKLILNKDQDAADIEGNHWELFFSLEGKDAQGTKHTNSSYPAQIIKGAMSTYLFDNTYDIKKDEDLPFGYVRMLKRHLTILGFYRVEKDPDFKYETYITRDKREDTDNWGLGDSWPKKAEGESTDELSRAIQHFHRAALERWRIDFTDGKLLELASSDISFDKEDDDVKAEIEGGYVGKKTKEELRRWLNEEKEKKISRLDVHGIVDIKPKYRNPFMHSFCNSYEIFDESLYKPYKYISKNNTPACTCEYDKRSGRIINKWIADPDIKRYCFVCTTATGWFFFHLFGNNAALGPAYVFDKAAASSVHDAVFNTDGRNSPKIFNTYFKGVKFSKDSKTTKWKGEALNISDTESKVDAKTRLGIGNNEVLVKIEPAFLASWMHEQDPDRYKNTINLLKLHKNQRHELNMYKDKDTGKYPNRKNKVQEFSIPNEIVKVKDDNSIILRYRPKKIVELFGSLKKDKAEYKSGTVTVKLTKDKKGAISKVEFVGTPSSLGITNLKLQAADSKAKWSTSELSVSKDVTLEVVVEDGMGPWRRAKVTFHKDDDLAKKIDNGKKVILASYDVKDTFCALVNPDIVVDGNRAKEKAAQRHQDVEFDDDYTCQCGLHLTYNQIIERKTELGYWNIVMETRSCYGHGNSALSFIYHEKKVYALHAEHNHFIKSLKDEVGNKDFGRHEKGGAETFYTVFKVINKDEIEKINQTFFWNCESKLKSIDDAEYDYFPEA